MLIDTRFDAAYWRGDYELPLQDIVRGALKPGDVVYDVGAHIGFFALGSARLVGPSGHVYAFEPDPSNASRLQLQKRENAMHNLTIVNAAVWSHGGPLNFRRASSASSRNTGAISSREEESAETILVQGLPLDSYASKHRKPALVKIDVEGGEAEVISGMANLMMAHRPTILCEIHSPTTLATVQELLTRSGYEVRTIGETPQTFPLHAIGEPPRQLTVHPEGLQ